MKITRHTWMLVLLLFVGALAVTTLYFYTTLSGSNIESLSSTKAPVQSANLPGSLSLTISSNGHNFLVGQDVDIILGGSSKGVPVAGYDAIVTYDPTILSFVTAQNSRDEFDMFINQKDGTVTITAGLKLTGRASALDSSILASLQFKVLTAGSSTISLEYTPGSKVDSNVLSEKTEDILGNIEGVTVRVGTKVVISKNQPTMFEGKKITFIESTIPESGCRDCQSVAELSVEENGETQILKYINGGFVGNVEREKTIGNTVYQLEDMSADSVTLIVASK